MRCEVCVGKKQIRRASCKASERSDAYEEPEIEAVRSWWGWGTAVSCVDVSLSSCLGCEINRHTQFTVADSLRLRPAKIGKGSVFGVVSRDLFLFLILSKVGKWLVNRSLGWR